MKYVSLEWQAGSFALLTGVLLTAAVVIGFSGDIQASYFYKHGGKNMQVGSLTASPKPTAEKSNRQLESKLRNSIDNIQY